VKVIRPRILGYAVSGAAIINALALASAIYTGTVIQSLGGLCLLGAFDALIWLLFVEPRVSFDQDRVEIRNPLRILRASWGAVTGFETKYGLGLVAGNKKFVAWSAPAPSRREVGRLKSRDLKGTALQGESVIEPGQLESSESGLLYNQFKSAKDASKNTDQSWSVSFNWLGVATLAATLVLGYLALHL
jgi:hypothetical protein